MSIHSIAVVGGHGKIARHLTEIVTPDMEVRSIIRNPEHAAELEALGAMPVVCDLEKASQAELVEAFGNADAVVFAAGAGGGSGIFRKYTVDLAAAIAAMQAATAAGIDRFVQISFIGAGGPTPEGTEEVFAAYWDAKREADNALRASGLDWTIVKPGRLLDEPGTGCLDIATGTERGAATRREDVAEFIAMILDDGRTVGREFDIIDSETPMHESLKAALGL